MPYYEYRCSECGAIEEYKHASNVRLYLKCSDCGHAPMQWKFPSPAIRTSTTFMANRGDGFEGRPHERKRAYARARAAGVNPSGKVYMGGLAESLHDPNAWINNESDVKRLCVAQGRSCEGVGIHVKAPEAIPSEPKPYRVADDLVKRATDKAAAEFSDLTPKEHAELTEKTRERITPKFGVTGKTPDTPLSEYA